MGVRHYNPDDNVLIAMGITVKEFAKGSFIKASWSEDDFVTEQGHHGSIIRAKVPNAIVEVTCTLMQGSPSNEELSNARNSDYRDGAGAAAGSIVDTNGTTSLSAPTTYVKKMPDLGLGSEVEAVEWTFIFAGVGDAVIGTNRLV